VILLKIAKQIQIHTKKKFPSFFRKKIKIGGKIHSLVPGFLSQFFVIEHLANFPSAKLVGFILGKIIFQSILNLFVEK
jgi:hypothetical protein